MAPADAAKHEPSDVPASIAANSPLLDPIVACNQEFVVVRFKNRKFSLFFVQERQDFSDRRIPEPHAALMGGQQQLAIGPKIAALPGVPEIDPGLRERHSWEGSKTKYPAFRPPGLNP